MSMELCISSLRLTNPEKQPVEGAIDSYVVLKRNHAITVSVHL